jgi:hypothetical protein
VQLPSAQNAEARQITWMRKRLARIIQDFGNS